MYQIFKEKKYRESTFDPFRQFYPTIKYFKSISMKKSINKVKFLKFAKIKYNTLNKVCFGNTDNEICVNYTYTLWWIMIIVQLQ